MTRRRYGNSSRRLFPSNRTTDHTKSTTPTPVKRSELSDLYDAINEGEDIFAEIAKSEIEVTSDDTLSKDTVTKKEHYVKEMVKKIKAGEIDYQKLMQLRDQLQYKKEHPESEIHLNEDMTELLKRIDTTVKKIYQEP